ncbi:hypothetical protein ES703_41531 [subsurface metagenome]
MLGDFVPLKPPISLFGDFVPLKPPISLLGDFVPLKLPISLFGDSVPLKLPIGMLRLSPESPSLVKWGRLKGWNPFKTDPSPSPFKERGIKVEDSSRGEVNKNLRYLGGLI